jgi:hypothetical protein
MKNKYKVQQNNLPGFNWVGAFTTKLEGFVSDGFVDGGDFTTTNRALAVTKAKDCLHPQDDSAFLVCAKRGTRWLVVEQVSV